jgi:glycosyltransferase involved in cell wall biosynthesis
MEHRHHILPKVSIVIPTKNRCSLLWETVKSIRNQTYSNWEAIIVDDDSTDETVEQMSALSKEDPRLKVLPRSSNRPGAPVCRNEGLAVSTGDYVIFLDSDDCLAPLCLENRVRAMQDYPCLDFGVFPCQLFRSKPGDMALLWNAETQDNDLDRFLHLHDVPWQTTSPIWRRQALDRLGPWDESLLRWQDWEFHFRALIKGLRYKRFAEPDCFWRMHSPERKAIGSKWTAEQVRCIEQLLSKVYLMLSHRQMFNERRRYLLASLYFWIANRWVSIGERKEAARAWTICWGKKLIEKIEYWEGLFYFQMWFSPLTGLIAKLYLKIRWSKKLLPTKSITFKNTPLPQKS